MRSLQVQEVTLHVFSIFFPFAQALLIYLFVELLQKCQVVQLESLKVSS